MSDSGPSTSLSILVRARAGEQDAWNRLVALYGPVVFERCRRCGLAAPEADDITQEVFTAVARGLPGFRKERETDSFMRWLRVIASNKIRDYVRKRARQPLATGGTTANAMLHEVPHPDGAEDPHWAAQDLKTEVFQRALQLIQTDFEEKTWRSFWLTVVEDRDAKGVAEQLHMTPGAVRQARYKVRKRLAAEFGELIELNEEKR
jgi:RNA polymerase sigma-70 factor (ECF subfamily)